MAQTKTPVGYTNNVKGSVHNLSLVKTTTMHPGFIYPIYSRKVLAGDRVSLDMNAIIKSNPLIAQLFSSFKLKIAVFFDSDSNYYGFMDNNTRHPVSDLINLNRFSLDVSSFSTFKRASTPFNATLSGSQIIDRSFGVGSMSMMDFAGVPVGSGCLHPDGSTQTGTFPDIDLGFFLSYINIVRYYYANTQQDRIPYCVGADIGTQSPSGFKCFYAAKLSDLEYLPMYLRLQKNGFTTELVAGTSATEAVLSTPSITVEDDSYKSAWSWFGNYIASCFNPSGGLFCDTFLPDQWVNILNRNNAAVSSKVTVTSNTFSIDTFRFQNKLQAWIDRLTVSGGRFSNWLRTVWGVKTSRDMDIPELMAVHQCYINPQPVVATASTTSQGGDSVDLGQQGGSYNSSTGLRRCTFKASTPGRVMVCVSLIPCVEYCQGIDPELVQTSFSDEYNPELSNLGFQDVPSMFYSMYPNRLTGGTQQSNISDTFFYKSVGKQVAWLNYMTDVNRCHGEFATGGIYEYWVLQRRFTRPVSNALPDDTSGSAPATYSTYMQFTQYINPFDFQYPFNGRSLYDPNWQLQLGIRAKWYRPIGKSFMPTIGR